MVASCHVKDALSAMTMLFSFLEIRECFIKFSRVNKREKGERRY